MLLVLRIRPDWVEDWNNWEIEKRRLPIFFCDNGNDVFNGYPAHLWYMAMIGIAEDLQPIPNMGQKPVIGTNVAATLKNFFWGG